MYLVLKEDLNNAIRDGRLNPGDRVPSESELIAQYSVSSTTARRCLDELENDGLVERQRGRGTFVSPMAAVLQRQRVAVVIEDLYSLTHPFLATVVGTIERRLDELGIHTAIVRSRNPHSQQKAAAGLVDLIEHENCRHALLLSNMSLRRITPLLERGVHCIGVNTRYLDEHIPNVSIDFEKSFILRLEALLQRGHRHFVILTQERPMRNEGVLNSASLIETAYQGLRRKFRDLPEKPNICYVDPSETLEHHVLLTMKSNPRPTAFVCWDELCGLEVMRILTGEGLEIPRDVSVIGSQILPTSPITCVDAPLEEMAQQAVKLMLAWIKRPGAMPPSMLIPPSGIIMRETLGMAPAVPSA